MSDAFWNTVRGIVANQLAQQGQPRHGLVTSVDPARAVVKVTFDEDGTESGWLPVGMTGTGMGASMGMLPTPGTQVLMVPDMGQMDHGVVVAAVHYDTMPAQKITPYKGEAGPVTPGCPFWIMGANSIQLTAAGFMVRGPMFVDGDLRVSGQISDLDNVHDTLNTLRTDYNGHKHGGVQTGGGLTGTTNMPTP